MVRDGLRTNAAGDGATRKLARLDRLIGLAVDGQGAGWLSTGPSAPLRNRMALPRWAIAGLKVVQTPLSRAGCAASITCVCGGPAMPGPSTSPDPSPSREAGRRRWPPWWLKLQT